MEMINPNEIGSKISTILFNAKQFAYFISPWIHISRWEKIRINLEKAKQRGIDVKFFIREISEAEDFWTLKQLRIPVYAIDRLHAKLFLNENEVIVTSMNLDERSYNKAVDIGLRYSKSESEYQYLYNYYTDYISSNAIRIRNSYLVPMTEIEELHFDLKSFFPGDTINATDSYIYFYQVIPNIDASIYKESISLKYKAAAREHLQEMIMKIKGKIGNEINTTENSSGHWFLDLNVPNNTSKITKRIIEKLREIQ